jgi:phage shock protein PspC (stress-responsive transcriptional regulator)
VAAAVLVTIRDIAGTAAGIAEFFGRHAFFTVAGGARAVRVRFAAGTGVFGFRVLVIEYIVLVIAGCAGNWF